MLGEGDGWKALPTPTQRQGVASILGIYNMGFKENLRAELKYQDMQLKELAQKTGINKNTLGNYLTGHNSLPTVENAVKISQALGVSVEYLVTGESESFARIFPSKYRKLFDTIVLFDEYDLASVNALVAKMKNRYEKI